MSRHPIIYSFRRCPYAMRARMALAVSGTRVALREVLLRDKPPELIHASPKATVPVLVTPEGAVIDESLDIMMWALGRKDPEAWLAHGDDALALIAANDDGFKADLDRYKYPERHDADPVAHRDAGLEYLTTLDRRLAAHGQLFGPARSLADIAIFPFVRQFAGTDQDWFAAQPLPTLQRWLADHAASALFVHTMQHWPRWHAGHPETLF